MLPTSAIITDANGVVHAYVSQGNYPGDRDANARLIAAAPELLTTLKQLVQAIALHGDKALNAAGLDSTVRQACDAIAKATGEGR
jgi:hypothetical protein